MAQCGNTVLGKLQVIFIFGFTTTATNLYMMLRISVICRLQRTVVSGAFFAYCIWLINQLMYFFCTKVVTSATLPALISMDHEDAMSCCNYESNHCALGLG